MKIKTELIAITLAVTLTAVGLVPGVLAQNRRPYRYGENYVRQLINRIETRSDRFSNLLPNALDRSNVQGTNREDDVNTLVTEFEHATDQLKQHFQNGQSTAADAERVLQQGALINRFMNNHRLGNRTERAWALVRNELNKLARTYSVALNWTTRAWPANNRNPLPGYDAMLTGTYRLNAALSNKPRTVANNATRHLQRDQRQRVSNNLLNRLTPPEMIAIERHGNSLTLASTVSPKITLFVDGREHREFYPNGRASQVRATFNGDRLTVVSNGDRANDFTVTFAPVNNGRRLLVTREIYAERLNRPVVVQSYYDKTAELAQWDLNNANWSYPNSRAARGDFLISDGTRVVAVLNEPLSTERTLANERFTMTVREPYQFRNAVIEGYVTEVDRGGRITGRSEMTLNFDRIRFNGRTYNFAGILEEVRERDGDIVRVDNEGGVQEDNRTGTTLERTAIGTAIGALVGAIAGGGSGAAIGAAVGAGAGAGSVYVQGHDDLDLQTGTRLTIRASAP
jgi:hypothetical protein